MFEDSRPTRTAKRHALIAKATRACVAALTASCTFTGVSQAQGHARAAVWHGSGSDLVENFSFDGRASAEDTQTRADGNTRWTYQATSYADLRSGAVGGSLIVDSSGPNTSWRVAPQSLSTVSDLLTFSGPSPAYVDMSLTITGSFHSLAGPLMSATSSLWFGGSNAGVSFQWINLPLANDPHANVLAWGEHGPLVADPERLSATLYARMFVEPGQVLPVYADLDLRLPSVANDHAVLSFGHTAQLGITLPEGYSFTSSSGVFMTALPPAPAVPEPGSAALLLAGLGFIGARWHQRRRLRSE